MFVINFNSEKDLFLMGKNEETCVAALNLLQKDSQIRGLTFKEACIATRNHRFSIGIEKSLPEIFISAPETITVTVDTRLTTYDIAGYWLYNGMMNGRNGLVKVPASLVEGNLVPILPDTDDGVNPEGLEITIEYPCPPPAPCLVDGPMTTNSMFRERFPDVKP